MTTAIITGASSGLGLAYARQLVKKNDKVVLCARNEQRLAKAKEELLLLNAPEEKELISHLASYTEEIISCAKSYDPTKITRYVTQLATLFHKFYNACRVKGDDKALMQARLNLCLAVKTVIFNVLTMLKITVPESM